MAKQTKPSPIQLAARLYGCEVEDLLSHRLYPDGSVVIIAPSGQKFTYSAQSIIECSLKSPEGPPTATPGPVFAPNLEIFEEQLRSGSCVLEVAQVTQTDPLPLAALEEIHAEAEKTGTKSEQTTDQMSCFEATLDGPATISQKKRRAGKHRKSEDAR